VCVETKNGERNRMKQKHGNRCHSQPDASFYFQIDLNSDRHTIAGRISTACWIRIKIPLLSRYLFCYKRDTGSDKNFEASRDSGKELRKYGKSGGCCVHSRIIA